jgi:hypothetical protein
MFSHGQTLFSFFYRNLRVQSSRTEPQFRQERVCRHEYIKKGEGGILFCPIPQVFACQAIVSQELISKKVTLLIVLLSVLVW